MSNSYSFSGAESHNNEIIKSRVGGFGGSDASMFLRIAERGLSGLTTTDHKRIAVAMKLAEPIEWGGNMWTQAGHEFEEMLSMSITTEHTREKRLDASLAHNFATFAHADLFFEEANKVVECKFVQKTTDEVAEQYKAQLQWYFLLGVEEVILCHGTGEPQPLVIASTDMVEIWRDEAIIEQLRQGIKTLDDAISDGWTPSSCDKASYDTLPTIVAEAYNQLATIKEEEAQLKQRKDSAVAIIKEYIEDNGLTGIFREGEKAQVVYTKASETRTFDSAKFLKQNPQFDLDEFYKVTKRSSSVSYK